jgi:hypothetical protein
MATFTCNSSVNGGCYPFTKTFARAGPSNGVRVQ